MTPDNWPQCEDCNAPGNALIKLSTGGLIFLCDKHAADAEKDGVQLDFAPLPNDDGMEWPR